MNAGTTSLLDLIKNTPRFVVPIFQRAYAWREEECSTLLEDILHIGRDEYDRKHFVGSVVYVAPEAGLSSQQAPRLLIDGQQRVATLSILLLALANVLGTDREVGDFSARKIRAYWLLNELENGDAHYKLLLSSTDRDTLKAIVKGHPVPVDASKQVIGNLRYFETRLKSNEIDLEHVCRGIRRLVVVEVSLSTSEDNPQLIFESLNSKGRDLSQSDLIRNYVLMRQDKSTQDELYMNYWLPLELVFREAAEENTFDEFMRHFLTLRARELLPRSDIYNLFRRHVEGPQFRATPTVQLLDELLRYARHYATIINLPSAGPVSTTLRTALDEHRSLQANVILPFLLEIHQDFTEHVIEEKDYIDILQIIETFLTRRFVCEVPTNQLRKVFFEVLGRLEKSSVVNSLTQYLMAGTSGARMPRDDEFRNDLITRDIYSVRRWAWLILKRLEQHQNGEPPDFRLLSIEHIMPQTLSDAWVRSLGENAVKLHKNWMHTIGNLTLTGYNPEYSNRLFLEKRDLQPHGLASSGLRLNVDFASLEVWDFDSIRDRAQRLAERAIKAWPIPDSKEPDSSQSEYSLDGFYHLRAPSIYALYFLLDKHIRSLNLNISQHLLKTTIQYKFRKSICDLIPNQSYIRVIINLSFTDIIDPKGLTRDISNVGHWGNGDVEARVQRAGDIDDVIALIKQALDRQLQSR